MGDDDSNSSDDNSNLSNTSSTKEESKPTATTQPKPSLQVNKLTQNQFASSSWSSLKQAAVASTIENKDKEKPIATNDTFQKYKMQLIEKERALKEQEQKLQKEKELQK